MIPAYEFTKSTKKRSAYEIVNTISVHTAVPNQLGSVIFPPSGLLVRLLTTLPLGTPGILTAGNMNDRAQTLDIVGFAPSCIIDPQVSHNKHGFGQEPYYSQLSRRERHGIYPQINTRGSHMFEPESTMGRRLPATIVGTQLWTPPHADVAPAWQVKGPCLGV